MKKIDFVIPWVDGNDKNWQEEKERYDTSSDKNYNNSDMRYRDWGTLKYVMRSIEKNCPWYHKIYLITEGHYPKWLDINHEKIVLVSHKELYFDRSHLPTFSSSSIEMNLANLKGISEKFVYLNDDTIMVKPTPIERFFVDDKPVDFFSHGWIPRNRIFKRLRGMNAWAHALKNSIDLVNRENAPIMIEDSKLFHKSYSMKSKMSNWLFKNFYKKFIWIEHWHHPIPYIKTTLDEVYETFKPEMMRCSANKFRANNDLTQYLYRYWRFAKGNFHAHRDNDGLLFKIENKKDMDEFLNQMVDYTFVCPNDSVPNEISQEEYEYIEKSLISRLEELFSKKAQFER